MADISNADDRLLELMKIQAEHARVHGAKMEMLYIVAQREAEIKRVKANIDVQNKRLAELEQQITNLKGE